jgi:hypothetical protein
MGMDAPVHARYDSEADVLKLQLEGVEVVEYDEAVRPGCTVAIAAGRIVGIEVLSPHERLDLLDSVALSNGLDAETVKAAAWAALAAPDRRLEVSIIPDRPEESELPRR